MKSYSVAGVLLLGLLLAACGASANPTPAAPPYADTVSAQLQRLGRAAGPLDALLEQPALQDQGWRFNLAAQAAEVEGVYETLAGLKPPSAEISRHVDLLSATGDCAAAMRVLTLAVDDVDAALLPPAFRLLDRCTDKITAMAQP